MAEQHRWGTAFVTFVVLELVTVAGCGGNADLGTVAGVVTLDGQPLANATVEFIPTDGGETRSSYDGSTDAFASYHPGGLQFLMCDGAVKFVDQSIQFNNTAAFALNDPSAGYNKNNVGLFQRLGIRNDGNVVSQF